MMKKVFVLFIGLALGATMAFGQKEIRWGTSRVGSSGHRAVTNLVQVIGDDLPEYNFTAQPTPGAILTVKGYATNQFEGYYGSDIAFYELANNTSRFEGFSSQMDRAPLQSFWTFTIEMGVGIRAEDRDEITSWRGLSGHRVFTGPRPWDTRAQLKRAFNTLGVNHEYIEVDIKTAGSLLDSGRFDAMGVYTNAEASTSPWITEASLQVDWAALSPSREEIQILKDNGFNPVQVDTSVFGKDPTYSDTVTMVPFFYGLHLGEDVSADEMYKILTVIEDNAEELARADKAFRQIADNMPEMQRRGVTAAADLVEIHPGLARYMRERGVWDNQWNDRIADLGGM